MQNAGYDMAVSSALFLALAGAEAALDGTAVSGNVCKEVTTVGRRTPHLT